VAKNEEGKGILAFAFLRSERVRGNLFLGICVKDAYQGKKIGSRLMEELIGWARHENAERIVLLTHTNNTKAISLYQKYGFKTIRHSSEQYEMSLDLH
jgi:ribosomal protein S18 acetylase RimI-like enzyme